MDKDETGKDGTLTVNGKDFVFTTISLDLEWDESSSDYNQEMETHHRPTGKDSSGSIEVDGSEQELKNAIMTPNGEQRDDIRITIRGSEGGDRFTDVIITNFGREFPGGDVTTTQVDWVANSHRPV